LENEKEEKECMVKNRTLRGRVLRNLRRSDTEREKLSAFWERLSLCMGSTNRILLASQ
jgi:hypothetical protein